MASAHFCRGQQAGYSQCIFAPETYAVVLKASNEPIGCVGIMFADNVNSCYKKEGDAEIGYWIGVPYWGQGLIPEAVKCLLARCFDDLGLQRVWCSCYDGNVKSRRVMDKCGLHFITPKQTKFRHWAMQELNTIRC